MVTLNDPLPSNFILDQSTQIYLENDSLRAISNIVNDTVNQTVQLDVSNYIFLDNQLVGIIIDDTSTGYSWGSSFRVIDTSGNTHTMQGNIPEFVIDASARYTISAKHAFSSFSSEWHCVHHRYDPKPTNGVNHFARHEIIDVYYKKSRVISGGYSKQCG